MSLACGAMGVAGPAWPGCPRARQKRRETAVNPEYLRGDRRGDLARRAGGVNVRGTGYTPRSHSCQRRLPAEADGTCVQRRMAQWTAPEESTWVFDSMISIYTRAR